MQLAARVAAAAAAMLLGCRLGSVHHARMVGWRRVTGLRACGQPADGRTPASLHSARNAVFFVAMMPGAAFQANGSAASCSGASACKGLRPTGLVRQPARTGTMHLQVGRAI
jgi:hypothetical protein